MKFDSYFPTDYNETAKRLIQAGQNIYWEFHGGVFKNNSEYITAAINAWFNEYQVTPIDVITSLYFPKEYTVGHCETCDINSRDYSKDN